jgi:hypothetical protein
MSQAPGEQNAETTVRQWLNDHLADIDSSVVRYPPHAVVDALAGLGLPSLFDIGWSEVNHDGRTDITTWTCTVATDEHLIDLTAQARRLDDHLWTGNSTRGTTRYAQEPTVMLTVTRLDSVASLTLTTEGSQDSADSPWPPRQTWEFAFTSAEPRTYVIGGRDKTTAGDARTALCQRLARNI